MNTPDYIELRKNVSRANKMLVRLGLVRREEQILLFGNVSSLDSSGRVMAIKPSGIPYSELITKDIVVLDTSGKIVYGDRKPSVDTQTHLEIYKGFSGIGFNINAIVHSHSDYAVSFAQARQPVRCTGTTHADYFRGDVPIVPNDFPMDEYEKNTGIRIVHAFSSLGISPLDIPACLVGGHGPFVWGVDLNDALRNALALEKSARLNSIQPNAPSLESHIIEKHFTRKHGSKAYYGQNK